MRSKLDDFQRSSREVLKFPSTLNSFQRMVVHDLAEEFALTHESVGVGEFCMRPNLCSVLTDISFCSGSSV